MALRVRPPGNAPAAGDRIGYIYIKPKPGQEASKLQGDRIEHPLYVKEKGLVPDYQFYIEHQIQNPVSQMFGLLLEQMPGFDTRRLLTAPTDVERRLTWCENEASTILFGPCLQKCAAAAKSAFVDTFFSGATTVARTNRTIIKVASGTSASTGATAPTTGSVIAKPKAQVDNFLMDKFVISMMKKNETAARKKAKGGAGASD